MPCKGDNMIILKILAIVLVGFGSFVVFGARTLTEKFGFPEKVTCSFESELTEEEISNYKEDKAVLNLKMLGILFVLPGIVLVLLFFK